MTRIAHLSDVHLSLCEERRERFERALHQALLGGCQHLVLTGDLTASGRPAEILELADALRMWRSESVTLIGGNHDLAESDWATVLRDSSPLARFAQTSLPGAVVDLGDCVIMAVSTQYPGRALLFRALGRVSDAELARLDAIAKTERRCVIAAMHHGPQWHPLQFFDGLTNRHKILEILDRSPHVAVLCGHDHRVLDVGAIFAAASVAEHDDPLRLYDVVGDRLMPVYRSAHEGEYLRLWEPAR